MLMKQPELTDDYLQGRGRDVFQECEHGADTVEEWREENDLYDSVYSPSKKDKSDVLIGEGKLFIPKTYSHTQRMLVDVMETVFFDPDEIISISSSHRTTDEEKDVVKALLNYRLNSHPIDFWQEALEASLDALRNKSAVFKVYPKLTTTKDRDITLDDQGEPAVDGEGEPLFEETERIETYAPQLECVPIEDVFFSTKSTWKNYYKNPIVHRSKRSLDYLKRQGYKNLDELEAQIGNTDSSSTAGNTETELRKDPERKQSPFNTSTDLTASSEVWVFEIWDFLDVNNDGLLESCSYIMAGSSGSPEVIIRDVEENTLPYKFEGEDYVRPPIVLGQAFPEPHKLRGKSLPGIGKGLQRETNSIRNQRREAVALNLRKPILVNRSANINLQSLVNRRIAGVTLGDDISPSSVREMDIKDNTGSSVQEQNRTDEDYAELTSMPPNLFGFQQSADETATAVTSQVSNANKKIKMLISNLANSLFLPSFNLLLRLEKAYETDEFILKVTEESLNWDQKRQVETGEIGSDFIQGDFALQVNVAMNKQLQLNKNFLLIERANLANQSTLQMIQAGVVDPKNTHFMNTMKMMHETMEILGFKNTEEFQIPAQAPTPDVEVKGTASQPGGTEEDSIEASVSNLNPEGTNAIS